MLRDPVRIDRVLRARDEVELIGVCISAIVWVEPGYIRNHPPRVANWESGVVWVPVIVRNVHRTVWGTRFLGSGRVD